MKFDDPQKKERKKKYNKCERLGDTMNVYDIKRAPIPFKYYREKQLISDEKRMDCETRVPLMEMNLVIQTSKYNSFNIALSYWHFDWYLHLFRNAIFQSDIFPNIHKVAISLASNAVTGQLFILSSTSLKVNYNFFFFFFFCRYWRSQFSFSNNFDVKCQSQLILLLRRSIVWRDDFSK